MLLLIGFVLAILAALALPARVNAQMGDMDIPYGGPERDDPAPDQLAPSIELPRTMPPVVGFADMMPFEVDASTPNAFAIDPASVVLQERYVLATVAVQSPSGAVTTGFYGFACDHGQYRLLAYPGKAGRWQAASERVKWRDVIDGETRNRQYRAVFRAGCRVGGRSADSVDEILRHLREGRVTIGRLTLGRLMLSTQPSYQRVPFL